MDASRPSASEATVRTFAFVDLAGFTALTEVHGDEAAVDVVGAFFDPSVSVGCWATSRARWWPIADHSPCPARPDLALT